MQTDNTTLQRGFLALPIWVSLFCGGSLWAQEMKFEDRFETPRDILAEGVGASSWDGFLGAGQRETADRIEDRRRIVALAINQRALSGRLESSRSAAL